jgi:GDP-L-fucose synthase
VDKLRSLGWQAQIPLHQGLEQTYAWFLDSVDTLRR